MSQTGSRAWWADVQHLRDAAERTDEARRRADRADLAARRAGRERGAVSAPIAPRRAPHDPPPVPRRSGYDASAAPRRSGSDASAASRRSGSDASAASRRPGSDDPAALNGRRTIEIRGRTVPAPAIPRPLELDRRRPQRRPVERVGSRPDRLAMWALLMGIMLILVAVTTADAATVASVAGR